MAGIQWISVVLIGFFQVSGAVSVDEVTEPIFGSEHDGKITLPCTFTTDSTALNITWSREYVGGKRKVAEFVNTELLAFDEFKGRVARGNQGSLVLLRPRAEDSGNYTCQAETDSENPKRSWHTDPVILTIVKEKLSIPHVLKPITANLSDCLVILPCDYKTPRETAKVTWFLEKSGGRRKVMTWEKHRLEAFDEFNGRVARGDRGALVLSRATSRDSGNYTCEVEVDADGHGKPYVENSTVELDVPGRKTTAKTVDKSYFYVVLAIFGVDLGIVCLHAFKGLRDADLPVERCPKVFASHFTVAIPLILIMIGTAIVALTLPSGTLQTTVALVVGIIPLVWLGAYLPRKKSFLCCNLEETERSTGTKVSLTDNAGKPTEETGV